MEYIFIGFYGWPEPSLKHEDKILTIAEGFELWNLRKFSAQEFAEAIKEKIPPINKNILRNYTFAGEATNGINEVEYGQSLWGLLLPSPTGALGNGYHEVLSILNLFSPQFMHPAFYVTDTGINKVSHFSSRNILPNNSQGSDFFITLEFVSFYHLMIEQTKYFIWRRDIVLSWSEEDWRLFMAADFYEGLEKYERSKTHYTWQRESADMATLLETLFTAGDTQNEEIGYRLRKRVSALIGWKIPDVEDEIKILYNDRSEFVHGSYYKKIIKGMKGNKNDNAFPPLPDFEKLYRTKEIIRRIFVAYLYLSKIRSEDESFKTYTNVQNLLEASIIDVDLRREIIKKVTPVVELLPKK